MSEVSFTRQKTIHAAAQKTAGRTNSLLRIALRTTGIKTEEETQMFFSTYLRSLKPVGELMKNG